MGAIPVVNENDSVSYTEIKSTYCLFGDNFMLSVVLKTIPWFWWNSVSESVLKDYEDAKATFKDAFWETAKQMNSVEQYYEYKWDDLAFGITEHGWL